MPTKRPIHTRWNRQLLFGTFKRLRGLQTVQLPTNSLSALKEKDCLRFSDSANMPPRMVPCTVETPILFGDFGSTTYPIRNGRNIARSARFQTRKQSACVHMTNNPKTCQNPRSYSIHRPKVPMSYVVPRRLKKGLLHGGLQVLLEHWNQIWVVSSATPGSSPK